MNYSVNARKVLMKILFRGQRGKCTECKKPLVARYGLRYVTPVEKGVEPENTEENVQLVHTQCSNVSRKHDRAREARRLSRAGMKPKQIAEKLEVSLRSVGRYLKDFPESVNKKSEEEESKFGKGFVFFEPSSQVPPILEDEPLGGEDDIPSGMRKEDRW